MPDPRFFLLHGLQIGQELFGRLRVHLQASFTVITYDQRDRGNTTFEPSAYTVTDLADDLASLIEALGYSSANVLGTSFGGMVAQAFALRHGNLLDGLVLGATSQAPFRPERLAAPVAALLDALGEGDAVRASSLLAQMAPAAASTGPFDASIGPTGQVAALTDRNDGLIRRFAATRTFDTRGRLAAMTANTLVIHGWDDAFVPVQDALSMASEIPHADAVVLAGCGHPWENEQPARAAAAIASFLIGIRSADATSAT
ncbi:alpha/beta fold hydrolase [Rhodococcus baikonurensis]|uniref:alpha/beta fold hydrolase n=1 Tax=Rhodococcus baikonurensis TaxID=172041 RepID=UPI00379778B0